jgi:hypothetical protein
MNHQAVVTNTYKVNVSVGNTSQGMRQSTLPFKKEQEIRDRDEQFKRKGLSTRKPKPLSNHKDDSFEVISDHKSTPDKKETKRGGGRAQLKRDAKSSKK